MRVLWLYSKGALICITLDNPLYDDDQWYLVEKGEYVWPHPDTKFYV